MGDSLADHLISSYTPASARYDEMLGAAHVPHGPYKPRAHWQSLFEQLAATPSETLRERVQWVRREVRENGVTYNVCRPRNGPALRPRSASARRS